MTEKVGNDGEIVGVALEHNGADRARPYVQGARVTFPVLVDEVGVTSTRFGFKVVPNGVLVDADGTIRWAKYGGFSIDDPDDVETVRRFFAGQDIDPNIGREAPYGLDATQSREIARLVGRGRSLMERGHTEDAVTAWQRALELDPENLVIRKQIWAARYPERFHPTIDKDWQKVQLAQERADEVARGICGPDGCPLPQRS